MNSDKIPAVTPPGQGRGADGDENDDTNSADDSESAEDTNSDTDEIDKVYEEYIEKLKKEKNKQRSMNKVSQNLKTLMKSTREKYKKVNFYYQKEDKRNKNARRYMEIIGRKLNLEAIRYQKHVLKLKQNWQEVDEEYRRAFLPRQSRACGHFRLKKIMSVCCDR